jgi:hypothetical protein
MMKRYGHEACRLLFTDTDSLCYHVRTADVYIDMHNNADRFDTSSYPPQHFLYDPENAKVAGKFKDETHGQPIVEYVGLKPKMYAYRTMLTHAALRAPLASPGDMTPSQMQTVVTKRAKGVPRAALRSTVSLEDYGAVLQGAGRVNVRAHSIRSWQHTLHTIRTDKVALSAFDSKRYVVDDGVGTLAYGHHRIGV